MQYKKLGKTDLKVSVLGFGTSPLGNTFCTIDPVESQSAVHLAVDRGINFFDVSPYYGATLAETRLGEALVGRRHQVVLATKCGRYGVDEFDFSAKRVTASLDESLARLKTDYVDLLQVHDVEFGDTQQIIHETIPALRKLQVQGKARFIGITGYPLKTSVRILDSVLVDTVLSYCRYNLMITDMDDVLTPVAKRLGVGLINASPLNMGILTERGVPTWHPAPVHVRQAGVRAAALARDIGMDLPAISLRYCLDHPYVSSTLIGMSNCREVEANLKTLQCAGNQEIPEEINHVLKPVLNFVWPSGWHENRD
jgi:L-galactose dehydrogenase